MNRRRLLVGLAIAVVLALVASSLVYRQLRRQPVVRQVAPCRSWSRRRRYRSAHDSMRAV